MKHALVLCLFVLAVVDAQAATKVIEFTPATNQDLLEIDLGGPVLSVTSVALGLTGNSQPKERSCDGPGGIDIIPFYYMITAAMMDNGVRVGTQPSEYLWGGAFDTSFVLLSDDWSFFANDGVAGIQLDWSWFYGEDTGPTCYTSTPGILTYDTVIATIEYEEPVPTSPSSWGTIKAVYR